MAWKGIEQYVKMLTITKSSQLRHMRAMFKRLVREKKGRIRHNSMPIDMRACSDADPAHFWPVLPLPAPPSLFPSHQGDFWRRLVWSQCLGSRLPKKLITWVNASHSQALHYFTELGCGAIINKIEINWEQDGKHLAVGRSVTYMACVHSVCIYDLISHQTQKKLRQKNSSKRDKVKD